MVCKLCESFSAIAQGKQFTISCLNPNRSDLATLQINLFQTLKYWLNTLQIAGPVRSAGTTCGYLVILDETRWRQCGELNPWVLHSLESRSDARLFGILLNNMSSLLLLNKPSLTFLCAAVSLLFIWQHFLISHSSLLIPQPFLYSSHYVSSLPSRLLFFCGVGISAAGSKGVNGRLGSRNLVIFLNANNFSRQNTRTQSH